MLLCQENNIIISTNAIKITAIKIIKKDKKVLKTIILKVIVRHLQLIL